MCSGLENHFNGRFRKDNLPYITDIVQFTILTPLLGKVRVFLRVGSRTFAIKKDRQVIFPIFFQGDRRATVLRCSKKLRY